MVESKYLAGFLAGFGYGPIVITERLMRTTIGLRRISAPHKIAHAILSGL